MIEPDDTAAITFRKQDEPCLPEVPRSPEEDPAEIRRLRQENEDWLEHHLGWRPFGAEW